MGLVQNNLHSVILVYWYIILLFSHPAIFKQTVSLGPILVQYDPNNWLYIGRWLIANTLHQYSQVPMASQYLPNYSRQDIARACQCKCCRWKPNIEPMWLDRRTPTPMSLMGNQLWTNRFMLSGMN